MLAHRSHVIGTVALVIHNRIPLYIYNDMVEFCSFDFEYVATPPVGFGRSDKATLIVLESSAENLPVNLIFEIIKVQLLHTSGFSVKIGTSSDIHNLPPDFLAILQDRSLLFDIFEHKERDRKSLITWLILLFTLAWWRRVKT
jgi:hypothetical protein